MLYLADGAAARAEARREHLALHAFSVYANMEVRRKMPYVELRRLWGLAPAKTREEARSDAYAVYEAYLAAGAVEGILGEA